MKSGCYVIGRTFSCQGFLEAQRPVTHAVQSQGSLSTLDTGFPAEGGLSARSCVEQTLAERGFLQVARVIAARAPEGRPLRPSSIS